ncbi:MAG TPA: hypothetical protein VIG69_16120, partial [Candidatus Methylomirabilis sp.]
MTRPGRKSLAQPKGPKSGPSAIGRSAPPMIVPGALSLRRRNALRRETEKFCTMPDASDLVDARRALPAQREALDRD